MENINIANVEYDIKKAKFALKNFLNNYTYNEKPDLGKAVMFGSNVPNEKNKAGADSFFWIYDYENIMHMIEMSYDYILKAEEELKPIGRE